jgi:tryptophanase
MERGTISMERDKDGKEVYADLELSRIALPRRVYSMSHIEYAIDRINWVYKRRNLIKGLKFVFEPPVLRFFIGKLEAIDNWGKDFAGAFKKEMGDR